MKILHINYSDIGGGAAIAAYRLHKGLLANGLESKLLVSKALSSDKNVQAVAQNFRLNNQLSRVNNAVGLRYINVWDTFNLHKHPLYQEADIVNIHIIHGPYGWFNYLALPALTSKKTTIFTLHDMWSFTGHCAYSYSCERWKIGCGDCPYPDTYPSIAYDNTKTEWKLKNWAYSKSNLTIVTPSSWLAEQAKASMLSRFPVHCIPYGLDTEAYQPIDREMCRSVLGLPLNQKIVMFGASNLKDVRKGGDLIIKALEKLPTSLKSEILLLTFGQQEDNLARQVGIKVVNLGYLNTDRLKSIAYSSADLFVFPSRADNLPLVLQESMACGLPMVSFKAGGIPDLVRPGITGYLAEAENLEDMCTGIVNLLGDENLRNTMSYNCREIALREYSLEPQARKYIELYKSTQHEKNSE